MSTETDGEVEQRMTGSTEAGSNRAYTRSSVEEYLHKVAMQQVELETAIAQARDRITRVEEIERRMESLTRTVGERIVAAHFRASRPAEGPDGSGEGGAAAIGGGAGRPDHYTDEQLEDLHFSLHSSMSDGLAFESAPGGVEEADRG